MNKIDMNESVNKEPVSSSTVEVSKKIKAVIGVENKASSDVMVVWATEMI